ncbi:MAG TPA: hypothetical protein VNS12_02385 [Pelagibacterium sp.]|uniref:hypothetical protein n=1 Tax=Pelagibacterium sp. TaxID=1967288 RepID=UPI002CCD9A5A|nr:hypothetical protein [Pelagibacterium sp.]HWJ86900.1 hypothetical protein [Pelagibacterium sp.]
MRATTRTRLTVTLCAAEALAATEHDADAVRAFLTREGGRERFSAGAHCITLLGVTGTATASIPAAFASWIRNANRKLEKRHG